MVRETVMSIGIDSALWKEAAAILETLGLTPEQAVSLFFRQVVMRGGLPFDLRILGERSGVNRDILREADALGKGEEACASDDWIDTFGIR